MISVTPHNGFVLFVILSLILAALSVFALVGLGIALFVTVKNYITSFTNSLGNACCTYFDYVLNFGFREYIAIIKQFCTDTIDYIKEGFVLFGTLPFFSLMKWVRAGSSLMAVFVSLLLLPASALVHIIVQSILFGVFKLISLFHR